MPKSRDRKADNPGIRDLGIVITTDKLTTSVRLLVHFRSRKRGQVALRYLLLFQVFRRT